MSLRTTHSILSGPSLPLKSRLTPLAFQLQSRNRNGTTRTLASATPTPQPDPQPASPPLQSLTNAQKKYLESALRVNHAGELAATLIYTSQIPPIVKAHPHLRPLMKHMYDQEAGHFKTFNHLLAKHRIRPTAMYPIWYAASTLLGWGTGVMGREAAMACTEAVETEIGDHYNSQVKELLRWDDEAKARGETLGEDLQALIKDVRRIRDEELDHLDHAVGEDAKMARPYEVLNGVIRAGCRGAIWVTERV
ncbi:ubiquinone biosynthesis monooxygenase Coq7 [Extremus antarcticus]|uniref:5-demethoxyubiquinone hydroxylase, mitochondrial n=1 Tax=Extremus antarcticus TaxID=702011 RepID=A0AAJ0DID6_9PEZI|nr:ubiquinone biosynthesis monooxygenase Coq7 [Extremus antarcticus]